jgi:DMSO/TMAO reductase YedYZ molybdopterin-dependent catalytic subunit
MITRGFTGRQQTPDIAKRLPSGQSLTADFPVLSEGPTPQISTDDWSFTLKVGPKPVAEWSWAKFNALPQTHQIRDIHCVTKWSKLDTPWDGVLVDGRRSLHRTPDQIHTGPLLRRPSRRG